MKFKINTKTFIKYVTPVADIALKNTIKDHCCEGIIKMSAYPNILQIDAYGGTASITVKVWRSDGYEDDSSGEVSVLAKTLVSDLKSFPPSDDLIVCTRDGKLKLSPASDIYNYVKIPIHHIPIEWPESPEEYNLELTVDRKYFLKGLKQIEYAPATEAIMFPYMCIVFESINNTLKYSAGTGSRFAVIEYIGNEKIISSGDAKIIFPSKNVPNITRILEKITDSSLCIKKAGADPTENIPDQIVIETDNITVRIYGSENFIRYPDLTKIVNFEYTYQIPTKFQDWKYIAEAITASEYSLTEDVHNIKIMTGLELGMFDIQVNSPMSMNRRVPFEPEACVTDTLKEKSYKPWFCCNAYYFVEMAKKYKKKKTVIVNFEDQTKLDDIPHGQLKQMEPVLLQFPDEIDKNGVMEKSLVFFAASTRWDDKYLSYEQEGILSRFEILDL